MADDERPSPEFIRGYQAAMRNCGMQFKKICEDFGAAPFICVVAVKVSAEMLIAQSETQAPKP